MAEAGGKPSYVATVADNWVFFLTEIIVRVLCIE